MSRRWPHRGRGSTVSASRAQRQQLRVQPVTLGTFLAGQLSVAEQVRVVALEDRRVAKNVAYARSRSGGGVTGVRADSQEEISDSLRGRTPPNAVASCCWVIFRSYQ